MRVIVDSPFLPNMMKFQRPPLTAVGKAKHLVYTLFEKTKNSKQMINWSPPEVLEWLCEEAHKNNGDYEKMQLSNFGGVDGKTLLNMNKDDFIQRDQLYGGILYQIVQNHKSNNKIQKGGTGFDNKKSPQKGRKSQTSKIDRPLKKRNRKEKCGRVWEFIRNLLLDPEYCPSLICWENYEQGIFRFVQSNKVAEHWGVKKKNKHMNFEKFSRAIRQNYKKEYLRPVQGRLIYGFGAKATGWRTDNPNFRNGVK